MKKVFICLTAATIILSACTRGKEAAAPSTATDAFTDGMVLPVTPVKDQGRSSLCWLYAMLATIETDHIVAGDSVNLSPDYAARMWLAYLTQRHYLSGDGLQISLRGMMTMVPRIMERYGMMMYDSYSNATPVNYNSLARRLTRMADTRHDLAHVHSETERMLDEHIGYLPPAVHLYSATYTPREFAHSLCREGDYEALTSFTHHSFGERFVLETADNILNDTFLNVPLDSLMSVITSALRSGHAVCWEGDTSERGFDFARGRADTPGETQCTQQQRQHHYEAHLTTDDHCMAIVGMARDREGRRYFKAKNSWGKGNRYGGMMYLSENYVRLKTIAIMVKKQR